MFDDCREDNLSQAEHDAALAYQEIHDLRQQLAIAEQRLKVAQAALEKYAADPDCCYHALEALSEMEDVK